MDNEICSHYIYRHTNSQYILYPNFSLKCTQEDNHRASMHPPLFDSFLPLFRKTSLCAKIRSRSSSYMSNRQAFYPNFLDILPIFTSAFSNPISPSPFLFILINSKLLRFGSTPHVQTAAALYLSTHYCDVILRNYMHV